MRVGLHEAWFCADDAAMRRLHLGVQQDLDLPAGARRISVEEYKMLSPEERLEQRHNMMQRRKVG